MLSRRDRHETHHSRFEKRLIRAEGSEHGEVVDVDAETVPDEKSADLAMRTRHISRTGKHGMITRKVALTDFGVLGSVRSIESEARPGEESAEDAVPVLQ
ncbi:hypothetical protein, partial [Streptomyces sp. NPDC056045]|uniref:hypothetical protein n=1 Tax=Streptomyces sp. NPDC056045 TaxID=3345691 RepID=UPI0035D9BA33